MSAFINLAGHLFSVADVLAISALSQTTRHGLGFSYLVNKKRHRITAKDLPLSGMIAHAHEQIVTALTARKAVWFNQDILIDRERLIAIENQTFPFFGVRIQFRDGSYYDSASFALGGDRAAALANFMSLLEA